jgi:hypothetical protein
MPTPLPTGRRNLRRRIERFLTALEGAGRQPIPFEAKQIATALDCLAADEFAEGEEAMMWAEKADIAPFSRLAAAGEVAERLETAHLRERLAAILAGH